MLCNLYKETTKNLLDHLDRGVSWKQQGYMSENESKGKLLFRREYEISQDRRLCIGSRQTGSLMGP